ncbi:hypothetical protein BGZ47_009019 [Haplosporangium gracile]|nr:hypothetical protein BGZ47_009019 [Haplosporangium gracile]
MVSLALLAVASAAPQGLSYGNGADAGALCSGPNCLPTEIPVSLITIVPETDFFPINNAQYNNYGNYDGYGYAGGLGSLISLSGAGGLDGGL